MHHPIEKYRFFLIGPAATVAPMEPATADPSLLAGRPAADLQPTPGLLLGPYYPVQPPADASAVLWLGGTPPGGAQRLRLQGCVRAASGEPVPGADVELWHADPGGRYRHPSAPGQALVLDGFTGYGRARTAADGAFAFHTLVPAGYADGGVQRTPHLHLQITGRFDRLVTQLFLAGHAGNDDDHWYRALRTPQTLSADLLADGPDAWALDWTAVLRRG